ncbi:UNVERIFIED_CONTAM: hypothetical protein DES50_11140 [Williamsia faeni]
MPKHYPEEFRRKRGVVDLVETRLDRYSVHRCSAEFGSDDPWVSQRRPRNSLTSPDGLFEQFTKRSRRPH